MNIDFIFDGSHDGPLLRLFSDQKDDIELLRSSILSLGNNTSQEIIISDLPMAISRIKLVFKVNDSDVGISIKKGNKEFAVELSPVSWSAMGKKLNPFLVEQTGFVWLYESLSMYLLFTTDGYW